MRKKPWKQIGPSKHRQDWPFFLVVTLVVVLGALMVGGLLAQYVYR